MKCDIADDCSSFAYLAQESPEHEVLEIIGQAPKRWARMDLISRAAVVEVGRLLKNSKWSKIKEGKIIPGFKVGLIAGSRRGSLSTDLAFAETCKNRFELASPQLFGYTLANIALAEAASHYNLSGPVYSILDQHNPLKTAIREARRWLGNDIQGMIAGELDYITKKNGDQSVARFELLSVEL
jgi:3-oxoacyl-(acyl-carrier-protein) synthase